VDDVPEYIVHWDNFVQCASLLLSLPSPPSETVSRMAAEYGLHPTYHEEFHHIFQEHHEHPEFGPLLERMRVVDANGESAMDVDQWEAASTCP
jgi:mRNA (guanine-N7-)-methyltransferase